MEDQEGRLDDLIGRVLLVGSGIGLLLMALGLEMMLAGVPAEQPVDRSPGAVLYGAMALNPVALMDLGILILMATPVVRVVALVVGFLWERRPRYALVSLVVLGLLFVSFVVAAGA